MRNSSLVASGRYAFGAAGEWCEYDVRMLKTDEKKRSNNEEGS
jgi:hypothetical protein